MSKEDSKEFWSGLTGDPKAFMDSLKDFDVDAFTEKYLSGQNKVSKELKAQITAMDEISGGFLNSKISSKFSKMGKRWWMDIAKDDDAKWFGNERGWNPTDYDEYVSLGTNADLTLSSQYKEMMPAEATAHVISLMKKIKTRQAEQWYNKQYQHLNVQKSNQEQMTWQEQYDEAQDYQRDASNATPLIDKLMEIRESSDKTDFVNNIIDKRNSWHAEIGTIVGNMHKEKDKIKAASTIAALNKLDALRQTPAGFHSGLLENS